ncbi:hypothetical protein FVF58_23060 [Paraburkholderia panacisoli]|uniref:Uncharacterized protein n=1 Tax=Paraburkholderia panacisoli TaxID=2603818 RepID=A0A5B0GZ54_9BURK|nr:hypothetical protein [Paraburkholderia panacisoli]KAA1008218.1 hypothetical protein FVF58_23060 [Paraburkholderia panacisoli]
MPKGKEAYRSVVPRINPVLLEGEIVTLFYSFVAVLMALRRGRYFLIRLSLTVCVGFEMVLYWIWQEGNTRKRT